MDFVAEDLWRCPVCGWLLESSSIRCDQCGTSPGFATAQAGIAFANLSGGLPAQLQRPLSEGCDPLERSGGGLQRKHFSQDMLFGDARAQQPLGGTGFSQRFNGDTSPPYREDMYVGIGMPQGFVIGGQDQQQLQNENGRYAGSPNCDPQGQEAFHNGFNAPPRPDGALFGKQLALDMEFPNLSARQPLFDQQRLKEQELARKPFGTSGPDGALYGNIGQSFWGGVPTLQSADTIPFYRPQSPLQSAPQTTDRSAFSSRSGQFEGQSMFSESRPGTAQSMFSESRPVTGQNMFSESRPVTAQSFFSAAPTQRSVGCSDGGSVFLGSSPPRGGKGDSVELFGPPASAKWLATQPMQSRRRLGPLHHSGGLVLGSVTE